MSNALIAGLGLQGVAVAYGLHVLGYEVAGIEISPDNIAQAKKLLEKLGTPLTEIHQGDAQQVVQSLAGRDKPDVVVSSLPFHLNYQLAELCLKHGLRFCDLGGNIETSDKIRKAAQVSAKAPVTTDQGLAPGIANIIAELGYQVLGEADSVKIRIGGLPLHPRGTLKYGITFSPQGLYNEYRDDCFVIKDGKKVVEPPLGNIEELHFDNVGDLEAFNTSGGIANLLDSMLERDVSECSYKTIRFPGHADLIRFLLFECNLDQDAFSKAMINACGFITRDQILIDITVSAGETVWEKKCRVLHDDNFTAMQKATGFGAAAVAEMLGSGRFDDKRYVTYADLADEGFKSNLNILLPEIGLE